MNKANVLKKAGVLAAMAVVVISFDGCNSGSSGTNSWSINGVSGPTITYGTNRVTISATLQNVSVVGGGTFPIAHMDNSYIEIAPNVTGGLLLQVSLSTTDVLELGAANLLDPQQLPGGRPLPGVSGGTLPSLAVQVPALHDVTFYIGRSIVGLFVPVNLGLNQMIGTFNFYDSSNKYVGQVSVVGEDANKANSGFLLLLNTGDIGVSMAQKHMLKL